MQARIHPSTLRFSTFLIAGLSLSIGWGIRGNFGHEYGAMIPGALTAIAVCLLSGRADWRERVAYFGFFGALGWAFGGSISYMQTLGYSHSGHAPSQYYGFFCLFVIGFLWAGMGGAGTAFPAVVERNRLTRIFRPLLWIFCFWLLMGITLLPLVTRWESAYTSTWSRHESPLYWFDADWLQALSALVALCLFDLWDQRRKQWPGFRGMLYGALAFSFLGLLIAALGLRIGDGGSVLGLYACALAIACLSFLLGGGLIAACYYFRLGLLLIYAALGALLGYVLQQLIALFGLTKAVLWLLLHYQGDVALARKMALEEGCALEDLLAQYLINWPQFFQDIPQHLGWMAGLLLALALYFYRHGRFRDDASLFVYMASGWLLSFLLLPTLLNLHMTPPRSDDWAGILGVFLGAMLWCYRRNLIPILYASLVSGIVGGLGFSGAAWLKLMMVAPGNPQRITDGAVIDLWRHWQSANWHSFLEQSYGFINGIGIALALGLLARKVGYLDGQPRQRRWTEVFAVLFVLLGVTFVNCFKNVDKWIEYKSVPEKMAAPLFQSIVLPSQIWFFIVWLCLSGGMLLLFVRHQKRPLAVMPNAWVGKGQLFYLVFLWMMVVANFERALPAFESGRIITEGVIFFNAILVSVLMLICVREEGLIAPRLGCIRYESSMYRVLWAFILALLVATVLMTSSVRCVYEGNYTGHAGKGNIRFGEKAQWRVAPILRGGDHS